MRRFWFLAVLMVLSPPVYAGSFAFSIGGHRIHIESSRYCRSTSCASVSISGIYQSRRDRDRYDDDNRDTVDPVKAPAAPTQTAAPIIAAAPTNNPAAAVAAPPPAVFKPAASATQIVAAPPPAAPRVEKPAEAVRPATAALKVSHQLQHMEGEPADTPVGDWQTEARTNLVRIETCGTALCGFVLDAATHTKGETVLINMKPKNDTEWTGNIYSRASGNSYYGTMTLKDGKTLRVEACAVGSFFCSGNNWTRLEQKPASADDLISSHETAARVRS
jgi:uncharacterized protein (DUF2147 family)